jgi:ubiquinone/menaquinone biosynthesis C-methylase UbiE
MAEITQDVGLEFVFRAVSCSVCEGERWSALGKRGGRAHRDGAGVMSTIVRCCECSHLYPNPMPFPVRGLGSLYTDTDVYFHGHDVERKKQASLEMLRGFTEMLGRRGRYLDVGCGRGEAVWAARELGWEYEGVDASPVYLDWGRENLGVEGRLGTIEDIQFPDAYFDVITMGGLIEHLYQPHQTLCEVWRVLRPGGILWFDAPNEDGLYMQIGNLYMRLRQRDWVVNLAPTFPPYHVQGFNTRSVKRLLGRAGFELEKLEVSGSVWPPRERSLAKDIEYRAAVLVNWVGNTWGMGTYMDIRARRL